MTRLTPRLAAAATALVGLINIASALTPNIQWRGHLLLQFEPVEAMRTFHAMALPIGAALLLVSPYLLKRRHRAWQLAIVLMIAVGAIDLLKGLDFEETIAGWGVAALLIASRPAFNVRHDPITLRSALWRVPLLGLGGLFAAGAASWAAAAHPTIGKILRETGDLLRFRSGPLHYEHHVAFHHHFAWIPVSVHMVEAGTLLAIAYVIFRPIAAPRSLPGPAARAAADRLVRAHGSDTLSFFKLRADKQYYFSEDRTAFVGYRIENGVMLLSGDPVGPQDAITPLLHELRAYADSRGLKLGAVGASEKLTGVYEELGCKTIYLGDEAVIETAKFSLEGRPIRKVRQSVTRLTKAGYVAELHALAELDADTKREIDRVIELGREGAPERGFSMAMDSVHGACEHETLVVLAKDEEQNVRGVLHFVPCYGRAAVSLSFMRRDPSTPNGLTEFLVANAAQLLGDRGIEELSLNFATFAKWMHSPEKRWERALGRLMKVFNPYFQIESLYRFNAKFFPRWEPRYLVYEGLLRTSLAAMRAEGQLPELPSLTLTRPSLRRTPEAVS